MAADGQGDCRTMQDDATHALDEAAQAAASPPATAVPLRDATDACQRQCITQALARHQGNWAQAARALDVDASNLHKLARRLGVKG